jgi:hypothetical protein
MLEIRAPPRSTIALPDSYRSKINQWKEQFVSDHHIIIYFHNMQHEMEFWNIYEELKNEFSYPEEDLNLLRGGPRYITAGGVFLSVKNPAIILARNDQHIMVVLHELFHVDHALKYDIHQLTDEFLAEYRTFIFYFDEETANDTLLREYFQINPTSPSIFEENFQNRLPIKKSFFIRVTPQINGELMHFFAGWCFYLNYPDLAQEYQTVWDRCIEHPDLNLDEKEWFLAFKELLIDEPLGDIENLNDAIRMVISALPPVRISP